MIQFFILFLVFGLAGTKSFAEPLRVLGPNRINYKTFGKDRYIDIAIPKCKKLLGFKILSIKERAKLVTPSWSDIKKIKAIEKSLIEFGKDLNFDFARRLSGFESTRFLLPIDANFDGRYHSRTGWTDVLWSETIEYRYNVLLHEMIHSVQDSVTVLDHWDNQFISGSTGLKFSKNKLEIVGQALNEGITSLTELFINKYYWPRCQSLKSIAGFRFFLGHYEVTLIDKIISDLAQAQHKNYFEIFKIFQEAVLTGNSKLVVDLLEQRYGTEFTQRLMKQRALTEDLKDQVTQNLVGIFQDLGVPLSDIIPKYQNHKLGLDDALKHLSWPPTK